MAAMRRLTILFFVIGFLAVVLQQLRGREPGDSSVARLSPQQAKQTIQKQASLVIDAIQSKNMDLLATYVDPVNGVRFSPLPTIDTDLNPVLSAREVRAGLEDDRKRVWGNSDASGEPIDLNFAGYYGKFIYDRDFARAPVIRFNEFAAKSTDRNNFWEIYPDAVLVEYYFPASTANGNDWAALRLAFEKRDGRWFLCGVIHDTWTM